MALRVDLLIFCLFVSSTVLIADSRMQEIFAARCEARCFAKTLGEEETCTGKCNTACVKPCADKENFHKVKSCKDYCREIKLKSENIQCRNSCKYLLRLYNTGVKSGICQSHSRHQSCNTTCLVDNECPDLDRCCYHSAECLRTCQKPTFDIPSYPSTPKAVNSTFIKRPRSIIVKWTYTENASSSHEKEATVFIVEVRYMSLQPQLGVIPGSWDYLNTTKQQYISVNPRGNFWSEYRILAVNEKGTSEYSTPSSAIYTPPELPTPPRDFRVKTMANVKGKVYLELAWSKPEKSDLPIHRYRVFWSRRLDTHTKDLISLRVHHKRVRPDQHSCVINGLRLNTTYVFEIQVISRYDGQRLRSKKVYLMERTLGQVPYKLNKEKILLNSYKKPTKKKIKSIPSGQTTSPPMVSSGFEKRPENESMAYTEASNKEKSSSKKISYCLSTLVWLLLIHLIYW